MKILKLAAVFGVMWAVSGGALAQPADPARVIFTIEKQPLGSALTAFARQAHVQILKRDEEVSTAGKMAPAVTGELLPHEALDRLLANSGLTYEFVNERTVRIAATLSTSGARTPEDASSLHLRVAQAEGSPTVEERAGADKQTKIEEIVVTAQKRSERLQDVPVALSAIQTESLVERNQLRLQDYARTVPGLVVSPGAQSTQRVAIRGVTTAVGNPTVAFLVDDVPFGASTGTGGGNSIPDFDPGELASIEVLRGPQGTLYGASSLSGLMKFVTKDPSMDGFSGRFQVGMSGVSHSDELGHNIRGSVNIPLSDVFALRASAFERKEAGYIDNIQTGQKDVNASDARGGRFSLLWRPSDIVSLKLNGMLQQFIGDAAQSVDVMAGDFQQSRARGTGGIDRKIQTYSVAINAKLGAADLTALTGYNINTVNDSFDVGFLLGSPTRAPFTGAALITDIDVKKFSQEIRVSTPIGQRFDFLAGLFYNHEDSTFHDDRPTVDPVTGASGSFLSLSTFLSTYEEVAAFTDLTLHATDRCDVQVGVRQSSIKQTFGQINVNALGVITPIPQSEATSHPTTFLLTPSFKIAPDLMVYARAASGYRPGGSNINPGGIVPVQYDPDKTRSYEAGVKGEFFARRLSLDASIFHIDWDDIQLTAVSQNFSFAFNGGKARSRGVELSMDVRPTSSLTISGWAAYTDAELTETLPASSSARGVSGDTLPTTPRKSGYLSVNQEFPVTGDIAGFVGADLTYLGERPGAFRSVLVRDIYPAFTEMGLQAGLKKDLWTANAFMTNVTDRRGALSGGQFSLPPNAFFYTQPRTFGVSLGRTF